MGTCINVFLRCLFLFFGAVHGWMNAMDQPLDYTCPDGMAIEEIESKHDNFFEDRVFAISCRAMGKALTGCHWTDYVNDFDQNFDFTCPNNSFLSGLSSYHDNASEDRRWKYYCCSLPATTLNQCYKLPPTHYDWAFSILTPSNFVIRGVSSTQDNFYQDRQYTFELCHLQP